MGQYMESPRPSAYMQKAKDSARYTALELVHIAPRVLLLLFARLLQPILTDDNGH